MSGASQIRIAPPFQSASGMSSVSSGGNDLRVGGSKAPGYSRPRPGRLRRRRTADTACGGRAVRTTMSPIEPHPVQSGHR